MKLKAGHTIESIMETVRSKNNGTQSVNGGLCMYRSNTGNACFIGCFIPDNEYSKAMEKLAVRNLFNNFPELKDLMPFESSADLVKFQYFHDNYEGLNLHADLEKFLVENVK